MVLCAAANMKIRLRPSSPSAPPNDSSMELAANTISSSSGSGSTNGSNHSSSSSSAADARSAAQARSPWFGWLRWHRRQRRQRLQLVLLDHGLYRCSVVQIASCRLLVADTRLTCCGA